MTLEVKIECVRDVQRWLATVNVSSSNPEVESVREAIAVLTRAPRPKQKEVEPLLLLWGVQQRKKNVKRRLEDTIRDFEEKVIEAAQKLQAVLANKLERTFVAQAVQRWRQSRLCSAARRSSRRTAFR